MANFIVDLDLFETNFSLAKRKLSKIYIPMVSKAKEMIESTKDSIISEMEN